MTTQATTPSSIGDATPPARRPDNASDADFGDFVDRARALLSPGPVAEERPAAAPRDWKAFFASLVTDGAESLPRNVEEAKRLAGELGAGLAAALESAMADADIYAQATMYTTFADGEYVLAPRFLRVGDRDVPVREHPLSALGGKGRPVDGGVEEMLDATIRNSRLWGKALARMGGALDCGDTAAFAVNDAIASLADMSLDFAAAYDDNPVDALAAYSDAIEGLMEEGAIAVDADFGM